MLPSGSSRGVVLRDPAVEGEPIIHRGLGSLNVRLTVEPSSGKTTATETSPGSPTARLDDPGLRIADRGQDVEGGGSGAHEALDVCSCMGGNGEVKMRLEVSE